ncbi:PRC1 regulator, partial [Polypterus senegalus]
MNESAENKFISQHWPTDHLKLLLKDMITEEENLKSRIEKNIITYRKELDTLYHELSIDPYQECRVKIFSDLRQQIHQLMKEIGHDPETTLEKDAVCDDAEAFLLTKENISALQLIVCQLEVKKDDLLSTKDNLKSKVYNLWSRLEFTEEEIKHFEASLKSSLSEEINEWQLELDRLEELKRANMEEVIEKIRKELLEFWDKCTYSTEQRESFAAFYDSNFTEELLVKHEDELSRLKSYYEKCKSVFEAVERWEQNWRLFQDFERKASDPSRFSNRGGSLLKESKERTKVQKLLPKLEEEIKSFIDTWEAEQGTVFLVRGQRFMDYVAKLWEDYKLQKEKEKNERTAGDFAPLGHLEKEGTGEGQYFPISRVPRGAWMVPEPWMKVIKEHLEHTWVQYKRGCLTPFREKGDKEGKGGVEVAEEMKEEKKVKYKD